ncbi:hypothetical protein [Desulfonatronovibrio hydrogenovorans]|uniref:hypothetical protein n=1 Tax=Desulfonatronovibrio hydrogenovorans TaxID=53245 RepID=UPI001237294C|nr:hypothetical protein [Desulfonatronovibrio hydrogenovorans]
MKSSTDRCLQDHALKSGLGPFELFRAGWIVIFTEIGWSFKNLCVSWEISQLKKRIVQEKIRLADLVVEETKKSGSEVSFKSPELDLVLGQMGLLNEEILYLEKELLARRQMFVEKRRKRIFKKR